MPISPVKSQRQMKKKADQATNRLYMDAEARRAREEKLRRDRGLLPGAKKKSGAGGTAGIG